MSEVDIAGKVYVAAADMDTAKDCWLEMHRLRVCQVGGGLDKDVDWRCIQDAQQHLADHFEPAAEILAESPAQKCQSKNAQFSAACGHDKHFDGYLRFDLD